MSDLAISPIAAKALEFVAERGGGVSLVEVQNFLRSEGIDTDGGLQSHFPDDSNVVIWAGMSEAFCDVLDVLLNHTDVRASTAMVYLIDGGWLSLPMAKRPPKNGYKKPHWLPIVFWEKGKAPGDRRKS
ncbi:MAG: hypothetical protein IT337_16920 [Thermomicrobiales bacterium]|nr:hypothetical protein [Thermomicrobiales bacterium]